MDLLNPIPFRLRLETARAASERSHRRFHPFSAGPYLVSAQASADHASTPPGNPAVEDVDRWEVMLTREGIVVDREREPDLFADPVWGSFWEGSTGRYVPTAIVQTLVDRLELGQTEYQQRCEAGPA